MDACAKRICGLVVFFLCLLMTSALGEQVPTPGVEPLTAMPSVIQVPPEAQPSANFNAEAATNAYLAQIPANARARSDAYFEGGYWMILWDFLYGRRCGPQVKDAGRMVLRFSPSRKCANRAKLVIWL
jgi:hypothetical protein